MVKKIVFMVNSDNRNRFLSRIPVIDNSSRTIPTNRIVYFVTFFFAIILASVLVSAADTEIKVKTLAAHKVSIFILASDEVYNLLESFHTTSDIYGDVSVTYSGEASSFDVRVIVKTKEGERLFNEKFDDYSAGELISIRIDNEEITGEYVPTEETSASEENETESEENETAESGTTEVVAEEANTESIIEEESGSGAITGEVVSEKKGVSKVIYVVMLVIVVLVFVLFLLGRRMVANKKNAQRGSSSDLASVVKTGVGAFKPLNKVNESGSSLEPMNKAAEMDRLEAKIKDMEREINKLRNQEKILEVQKRIDEDRKELDRLQQGG